MTRTGLKRYLVMYPIFGAIIMPMLLSPTYVELLKSLRQKAPPVADLVERIATALKPECQTLNSEGLERVLLARADAVAQEIPYCVTRMAVWLNRLAANEVRALEHCEVAAFVNEAACLGGPCGVATG